jgi:trimeric autotransporter adhesin
VNLISGINGTIGGGNTNKVQNANATIGGGRINTANGSASTIAGGVDNFASGSSASIGGGFSNVAEGAESTVAGGKANVATSLDSSIGGGAGNQTDGQGATIAGGEENDAGGSYASVPGGQFNTANGSFSFAAGRRANALHAGSFVWGDSTNGDVNSSANNQFTARCSGGVRFFSNSGQSAGVTLAAGSSSWGIVSDRNAKERFSPVDTRDVLNRVASLSLSTWNYKAQDQSIRHMGPMAQDFRAAFGLGEDDRHISSVDADGVAIAAIQGLNEILKEKDAQISELSQRVVALETLVSRIANQTKENSK